jgi:diguanylate cyclase (GGDEF)-like protein
MQSYFEKAIKESEHFAIAMINIDNFKKINDTYGHENGDKAINSVADILRANTSQNDIVSRFGSEEFCVALKNVSADKALEIFEKLREKVQNSVTTSTRGEEIIFTISIGVAINYEDTLEESINQADMLLYEAKQNGRNRIVHN